MHNRNTLVSLETAAVGALARAYAPYPDFHVGAAVESSSGAVFTGCNVANTSFCLMICAERSAVFAAFTDGVRRFRRIVILADSKKTVTPGGAFRQMLAEFSDEMEVVRINLEGENYRDKLPELLPRSKVGILENPCST